MPSQPRNEHSGDPFPVGMRVLAVDDDPTCLKVLESLLRKCQYHVTTTGQAVMALKLLRENQDKFDLVISDVQMPDMDGFKLLELVGLEMDLPVIMLSSYGDTKLVMKGITHGACDYLLKPVRVEELKNIWQHVVRRRKANSIDIPNNRDNKSCGSEERNKSTGLNSYEQNAKVNRKRKDQNEEDGEEYDENVSDNDDLANQKKPRVVWTVELHRKFVAAVHALGFDKAVPKKILELMNVDKLTRENVASHLQKYRLYLKRLSAVAHQQGNMVAALGNADSAYLRMGAASFHDFNSSLQLQNSALRSIPSPRPGLLGRLDTTADIVGLHGMSPSGVIPSAQAHHIPRGFINGSSFLLDGQAGKVLQGMPTSLECDQLQHKDTTNPQELIVAGGNDMMFMESTSNNVITGIGSGNNSILDGNPEDTQTQGAFVNQSSVANMSEARISDGNWASSVPQSAVKSTSFPSTGGYPTAFQPLVLPRESSSTHLSGDVPLSSLLQDSRLDTQNKATLLGNGIAHGISSTPRQGSDKHSVSVLYQPDFSGGSMKSSVAAHGGSPSSQSIKFNRNMNSSSMGHPVLDSFTRQQNTVEWGSTLQAEAKLKQVYHMEHGRPFGGYPVAGSGFLEDIVTAAVKWEPDGAATRGTCK